MMISKGDKWPLEIQGAWFSCYSAHKQMDEQTDGTNNITSSANVGGNKTPVWGFDWGIRSLVISRS